MLAAIRSQDWAVTPHSAARITQAPDCLACDVSYCFRLSCGDRHTCVLVSDAGSAPNTPILPGRGTAVNVEPPAVPGTVDRDALLLLCVPCPLKAPSAASEGVPNLHRDIPIVLEFSKQDK